VTPAGLDILTHSRLATYRECARKEKLKYRDGYRPVHEEEALRLGSLLHRGLEAWWRTVDGPQPLAEALTTLRSHASDPLDLVKAEEMLRGYHTRWHEETKRDFEIVSVEGRFEIPLINPETMMPSRTFRIAGRVDVAARLRRTGEGTVVEHKSTAENIESDADTYWAKLAMDHQLSTYVLGAESFGLEVKECLYDVLRKPGQRLLLATPVESRKYTKNGTLYAAQREVDETPEEYRLRIREEIEQNLPKHFQRRLVPRLNSQIQDFMFDAWATARSLRESELADRAPRNPDACHRYGVPCPYWEVCANGEDIATSASFKKVTNVHPELEDSSVTETANVA
jgi:hypothetical protein